MSATSPLCCAALYSASSVLAACRCCRAYCSYTPAFFSAQEACAVGSAQSWFSIISYAARSAHFVLGYFVITSFIPDSSIGFLPLALAICQSISAERHRASPASGVPGNVSAVQRYSRAESSAALRRPLRFMLGIHGFAVGNLFRVLG